MWIEALQLMSFVFVVAFLLWCLFAWPLMLGGDK